MPQIRSREWQRLCLPQNHITGNKEVIMIVAKTRNINKYCLFCYISYLDFVLGLNFYLLKINTYFKHSYYTIFYHYSLNDFKIKDQVDTREYL